MEQPFQFNFSSEKNRRLIEKRGISFEEVIAAIEEGLLLDVIEHPNPDKYPRQKMYVVYVNQYVYLVPFVIEENHTVFLKTVIPSRKAKKDYLGEE